MPNNNSSNEKGIVSAPFTAFSIACIAMGAAAGSAAPVAILGLPLLGFIGGCVGLAFACFVGAGYSFCNTPSSAAHNPSARSSCCSLSC